MLYNDNVSYNASIPYNGPVIVPPIFIPSGAGGRETGRFRWPTIVRIRPEVQEEIEARRRARILIDDEESIIIG